MNLKSLAFTTMAFVSGPALPSARKCRPSSTCAVRMATDAGSDISRRTLLKTAFAATVAAFLPKNALAEREYGNVGFLGGGDRIDINNANIRAYLKIPGVYPTLASIIVNNGPYEEVDEIFDIPGLTEAQKDVLVKHREKFVALPPAPEYEIDKVNNGLYK